VASNLDCIGPGVADSATSPELVRFGIVGHADEWVRVVVVAVGVLPMSGPFWLDWVAWGA
jgi:hypothetical protein